MTPRQAETLARPDVVDQQSRLSFKINNFDLIRLFAAVQVLIFHAFYHFSLATPPLLAPLGWFRGVPIFFVISGYLISASYERNRSLRVYARNRALRILPGLWACIAATVVVASLFGFGFLSMAGLGWFLSQLVGVIYTPAFLAGFGDGSYNGSLWTIPVELQFYVLLPILYWVAARRRDALGFVIVFVVFLAIGATIAALLPDIDSDASGRLTKLLRYSFVPRYYLFLFGVLLQRLRVHVHPLVRDKGLYWLAGYAAYRLVVPDFALGYIVDELASGITVVSLAYTAPTIAERLLRGNDLSYGVYLFHGLVINAMIEFGYSHSRQPVVVALAASLAVAYLSWILVERPMIRSKGRRRAKPEDRKTPSVAEG